MRILLAEDERELAHALEVILKHNNYSCDIVFDGQDALDYALAGSYDVIVLDIMMPKIDGITVLKTIRKNGINTPVLLLTAKVQIEDKVLGLDSGADDYLTKPFASKELIARIRALGRRNNQISSNEIRLGNTTLDLSKFVISTDSDNISLTNKEFQVLEELIKNPGHVVSVEDFMNKIWGIDSEAYDNIVWVNISYLRKKLASINSNISIKAQRNLGYYVEAANDKQA